MDQIFMIRSERHPVRAEGKLHYCILNTGDGKEERWSLLVIEEKDRFDGEGHFFYDLSQNGEDARRILAALSEAQALPEELGGIVEDVLYAGANAVTR